MRHLKTYENIIKEPKIGDYVIMRSKYKSKPELTEFIENTIGEIFSKYYSDSKMEDIRVIYDFVPDDIRKNFMMIQGGFTMWFKNYDIIEYAKTKKELKLKIAAKKYNI
jgi:hypothetical protein